VVGKVMMWLFLGGLLVGLVVAVYSAFTHTTPATPHAPPHSIAGCQPCHFADECEAGLTCQAQVLRGGGEMDGTCMGSDFHCEVVPR
jgi:hypothetical protein